MDDRIAAEKCCVAYLRCVSALRSVAYSVTGTRRRWSRNGLLCVSEKLK